MSLKKIVFKNKNEADPQFPEGYEPLSAENLNAFQDNIEKAITEETSTMNTTITNKLSEIENSANTKLSEVEENANQKLTDIQNQVDTAIEDMKGLVDVSKIEELETEINTLKSNTIQFDEVEEWDIEE